MKNLMVGMLPSSGTYVLAHLDGTPVGQGVYETLLRDLITHQHTRDPEAERLLADIDASGVDGGETTSSAIDAFEAYKQARTLLPDTLKELAELREWKCQQLEVEATWDVQAVGRLLNLSVGQDVRPQIQAGVQSLLDDRARANALMGEGSQKIEELQRELHRSHNEISTLRDDLRNEKTGYESEVENARKYKSVAERCELGFKLSEASNVELRATVASQAKRLETLDSLLDWIKPRLEDWKTAGRGMCSWGRDRMEQLDKILST